jgi:hypothetical protein
MRQVMSALEKVLAAAGVKSVQPARDGEAAGLLALSQEASGVLDVDDFLAFAWVELTSRDLELAGDAPGDGKKPYGKVKYADAKNGKYPIDTEDHAKAAWAYINKPKNAGVYPLNGVSLASVKSAIAAACKKFGIDTSGSSDSKSSDSKSSDSKKGDGKKPNPFAKKDDSGKSDSKDDGKKPNPFAKKDSGS